MIVLALCRSQSLQEGSLLHAKAIEVDHRHLRFTSLLVLPSTSGFMIVTRLFITYSLLSLLLSKTLPSEVMDINVHTRHLIEYCIQSTQNPLITSKALCMLGYVVMA